ncbi:MAG: hypothetical protein ACE3JN_09555 [Ectobacillus sp.]
MATPWRFKSSRPHQDKREAAQLDRAMSIASMDRQRVVLAESLLACAF